MVIPGILQLISIGDTQTKIFVPDATAVKQYYSHNKEKAYWAKIWPASIGLCRFLKDHKNLIEDRTVLELAAGLGLPGLYAAPLARQVYITDIEPLAIDCVNVSVSNSGCTNITTATLHWSEAIVLQECPEVLLLSDVNYDPAIFEELTTVLLYFLQRDCTIIISTPQRLVAKEFINRLLCYCIGQWSCSIPLHESAVGVSVFVLKRNPEALSTIFY